MVDEGGEPDIGVRRGVVGQTAEPGGGVGPRRGQPQRQVGRRPDHEQPFGDPGRGGQPGAEDADRAVGVVDEEAQSRDRRAPHARVRVGRIGDERLGAVAHHRRAVRAGRRGGAVRCEPDTAVVTIHGFASDTHQQPDDGSTIGGRGIVGQREQERQTRHRAHVHVTLVVGRAAEIAERPLPDLGIG
ncbi:hypothetical protein ACFUN7_01355 [Streptomyces sp. NPDC057236]|uniref:hypothetical protein n=1 Tax=Streptomyces sp. NPDC057236 TaxID=3346059 RepID=UPI003629EB61